MAKRLLLVDQRPINNAADATNYTLWEMGHPTHVFDLDLLEGGKILVRRAFSGETLKTLDGVERKLTPEDLVIADAVKPVALAGVMGGFDTMITAKTKNILIESAWFDPVHGPQDCAAPRPAYRCLASFRTRRRFRGHDRACDRVAALLLESAGGKLDGGAIDVVARQVDLAPVALHLSEVHRILGEKLETNEIFRILQQLGFELMPERGGDPDFTVHIPSWRLDVEREIDLVEEIARLHGYDKFANTLPAYAGAVVEAPDAEKDHKLRTSLLALGYDEAVSLTFISHEDAETFSSVPGGRTGQSAKRRSVGDAEFAGARHAQYAGLQPQPRGGPGAPVRGGQRFRSKGWRNGRTQTHLHGRYQPTLRKKRKGGAPRTEDSLI